MLGSFWGNVRLRLRYYWRPIFAIVVPILLIPIAYGFGSGHGVGHEHDPNKKFRAAYVVTLMALFWVFEVMPLAVTSLLPLVLFPLLAVQEASVVSQNYMRESNMIFLGSIIIALSIEYCGLHVRGALTVIRIFGVEPPRIMLGTMFITVALSMWISDTSCITMILPILFAILSAMFQEEQPEVKPEPEEEEDEPEIPLSVRNRRVSTVFGNSAMQSHHNTAMRRRSISRRSIVAADGQLRIRPISNFVVPSRLSLYPGVTPNPHPRQDHDNMRRTMANFNAGAPGSGNTLTVPEDIREWDEENIDEVPPLRTPSPKKTRVCIDTEPEIIEPKEYPEEEHPDPELDIASILHNEKVRRNIRKMLLFAAAYAANIGGTGTLVGTGPIKVFKELNKIYLHKGEKPVMNISFATWMAFTIPVIIVNIIIVWFFLTAKYFGIKNMFRKTSECNTKREREKVKEYLDEESKKLGPISSHEIGVVSVFILVVVLWITRDPQLFPGWNDIVQPAPGPHDHGYKKSKTGDSTAAMLAAVLLFIIPKNWDFLNFKKAFKAPAKYEALLDWKFVSSNAPWGYVILIGSGYAIADACNHSGLSCFIANGLVDLKNLSRPLLLLIVMAVTNVISEVVSNTASATLILPILFSVSCALRIHPTYLSMASALSSSYAFILPISSPPNAIVFATGDLSIKEMVTNGLVLNIVCTAVLYAMYISYGEFIFHFDEYHEDCHNVTLCGH